MSTKLLQEDGWSQEELEALLAILESWWVEGPCGPNRDCASEAQNPMLL